MREDFYCLDFAHWFGYLFIVVGVVGLLVSVWYELRYRDGIRQQRYFRRGLYEKT